MLPHTMSSRIQYKYNHCLILRLKALSFSSETKFCSVRLDGSCSFIRLLNQPQIWNFLAGFLEISSHNLEFLPNLCGNTGFFKTAVAPRDFCKKSTIDLRLHTDDFTIFQNVIKLILKLQKATSRHMNTWNI